MKLRTVIFAAVLAPAVAFAEERSTQAATDNRQPDPIATPYTSRSVASGTVNRTDEKMSDARLASMLHRVNRMEIDAGELAIKQGSSAGVKDFGRKLVADHKAADEKLTALAKKDGLDLSSLSKVDKEKLAVDQKKMDQVESMRGAQFDRSFAQVMYNGHDDVLNMLDKHAGDIRSPDLKKWVDDAKPVLERHKQMADQLRSQNRAETK
jgi:putative membrane protein